MPTATCVGFALRFYSEQGKLGHFGNNTRCSSFAIPESPILSIRRNGILAATCARQRRMWDFLSAIAGSLHQVTILMSRSRTATELPPHRWLRLAYYSFINAAGELHW